MGEPELRCVHCGSGMRRLLVQYSPGNIRLLKCDNCKMVADPYVECEFMIILIDLILHKQKAYRHLLFNVLNEDVVRAKGLLWKSALIYLILDGYRSLFQSELAEDWRASSHSCYLIWISRIFVAVIFGNFMFFGTLICTTRLLLRSSLKIIRFKGVLITILFSSYFRIFLIATMVWEFPSSAILINDIFVLSSNAVALKVLKGWSTSRCTGACLCMHAAKFVAYTMLLPGKALL